MFENQKFLTRGVENKIPSWLTNLMWHMVATDVSSRERLAVRKLRRRAYRCLRCLRRADLLRRCC